MANILVSISKLSDQVEKVKKSFFFLSGLILLDIHDSQATMEAEG